MEIGLHSVAHQRFRQRGIVCPSLLSPSIFFLSSPFSLSLSGIYHPISRAYSPLLAGLITPLAPPQINMEIGLHSVAHQRFRQRGIVCPSLLSPSIFFLSSPFSLSLPPFCFFFFISLSLPRFLLFWSPGYQPQKSVKFIVRFGALVCIITTHLWLPTSTFVNNFYPRDAMLARSLRQRRVCLSVCHTLVVCLAERKQDR